MRVAVVVAAIRCSVSRCGIQNDGYACLRESITPVDVLPPVGAKFSVVRADVLPKAPGHRDVASPVAPRIRTVDLIGLPAKPLVPGTPVDAGIGRLRVDVAIEPNDPDVLRFVRGDVTSEVISAWNKIVVAPDKYMSACFGETCVEGRGPPTVGFEGDTTNGEFSACTVDYARRVVDVPVDDHDGLPSDVPLFCERAQERR